MFDRDGRHLRTVDALTGVARAELRLRRRGPPDQRHRRRRQRHRRSSATATGKATAIKSPPATCARSSRSAPTAISAGQEPGRRGASRSTTSPAACSRRSTTRAAKTAALHLRGRHRPADDRQGQERRHRAAHGASSAATGFRVMRTSDMGKETRFAPSTCRAAARADDHRPVRRRERDGPRRGRRHHDHRAGRHRHDDEARRRPALGHARADRGRGRPARRPAGAARSSRTRAPSSSSRPRRRPVQRETLTDDVHASTASTLAAHVRRATRDS